MKETDFDKETLSPGLRIINDGFEAVGSPDGLGALLVNMEPAKAFRTRMDQQGTRITFLHLLVKATALAVKRVPESAYFLKRYTLFKPRSVNVGVSVAGKNNYAPVILVKSAENLSCAEIAATVREESRKKRTSE